MTNKTSPSSLLKSVTGVIAIAGMLSACSTAPKTPSAPGLIKVEYSQNYPDGSRLRETPTEVKIVKRETTAKVVAAQVGLNVLTFLVGGGIQAQGFSKDNLKGSTIDDIGDRRNIQNPTSTEFVLRLQNKIDDFIQKNAAYKEKAFTRPILVAGGHTALVYETLSNDEEVFRLKTDLSVYMPKAKQNPFSTKGPFTIDCQNISEQPLSQQEWAKDDYLLVKTQLESMFSACENKVMEKLPQLLKS